MSADSGVLPSKGNLLGRGGVMPHHFTPQLLAGEVMVSEDADVTHLDSNNGPVRGKVYVTTFKLGFIPKQGEKFIKFEVPLGLVNKVDKIGGQSSRGENAYGLEIVCKDLRTIRFAHKQENHSRRGVYEALMAHAFPVTSSSKFFAFSFGGLSTRDDVPSGWKVYNPEGDFGRMGIPNKHWRVTDLNKDYELCSTYPAYLVVPASCSDQDIRKVAQFRSRDRLPGKLGRLKGVRCTKIAHVKSLSLRASSELLSHWEWSFDHTL